VPSINQMKAELYSTYPLSKRWKKRVDHMSRSQIIAIWYSFQKRKERHILKTDEEVQLPLFDLNNF
jgi:hypothetical protein